MTAALAYARTQRETASPERLMVMLFDRALLEIKKGIVAIEVSDNRETVRALTKASDIIAHLSATLDHTQAPALCERLTSVYRFCAIKLTQASLKRDMKAAREAEQVFAPIVDAFRKAVVKAATPGSAR